jgi:hypothetical protein
MNAKQFFDKVVEMRNYQQLYYRTRATGALQKAKELEREIDAEIERVKKATVISNIHDNPELLKKETAKEADHWQEKINQLTNQEINK